MNLPSASLPRRKPRSVDVYVSQARKDGQFRLRHLCKLDPGQANRLIGNKFAEWRGKSERAILFYFTPAVLGLWLNWMKVRGKDPVPVALDNRTHVNLGGQRGYRHARNEAFTPLADELMQSIHSPDKRTGKDLLEQIFQNMGRLES
jgi:hypothetical protein